MAWREERHHPQAHAAQAQPLAAPEGAELTPEWNRLLWELKAYHRLVQGVLLEQAR